jgi:electron transfer flavoprotein alpha subunit
MDILIYLENNNGNIHRISLEAVAAGQSLAKKLGLSFGAVAIGDGCDSLGVEASKMNLNDVITISNDQLKMYSADGYSSALAKVIDAESPQIIVAGHSYQLRDFMPRVSAKLGIPFLSDNISVREESGSAIFTKQVFNAKLIADVTSISSQYIVSFQSAAFSLDDVTPGSALVRSMDISLSKDDVTAFSESPFQEEVGGLDLTSADIIVSIGRGIGKEENIPMATELAKAIGGELASSRPVVDSGWLPSIHQVGSSGQSVAPKVYLALGISGAIQHVVGMKGSKNIIAINKDTDAPIFEISDYGVVGDILEIIPKLTKALQT